MSVWQTLLLIIYVLGVAGTFKQGLKSDWRSKPDKFTRTYGRILYGSLPQIVLTALIWPIHTAIGIPLMIGYAIYVKRKYRSVSRRTH